MMSDHLSLSYHDVMEVYKRPMSVRFIPRILGWTVTFSILFIVLPKIAYAETLWVQVPQWSDDWEKCAVDVPDSACHWYVANADNTFGEGFDWESAPWYSAEGLKDVAPIQKETVVQKLQNVG